MFRIGVLEDETSNFDELKRYIQRYGEENNVSFEIERHTDGQKFLEDQSSNYDIIFLDIEVPGASGLQVAEQIRERDKDVVIFFCTRLSQYAIYGYQVEAMDYILKPVRYSSIKLRLDKALHRVQKNRNNEKIVLRINRGSVRLSISEIYYVEASKHKTVYYTQHGVYEVWSSFKEAKKLLEPHHFVQCHGSYLCNLRWVSCMKDDEVIIKNVAALKISRNLKKQFSDTLTSYWAEVGG